MSPAHDLSSISGMVFDIQRFSTHDGPGIRTTVFFKGCPLRCRWCHNPESISTSPILLFTSQKCIGCGACFSACPNAALDPDDELRIQTDRCQACGRCAQVCPTGALEIAGAMKTVAEVMAEVEADRIFYQNSQGGVTFSGGEALLQPQFLKALLQESKRLGLHTALDTTGYLPWETMNSVLPYVDLVLYDLKHIDNDRHRELTGVPNRSILANLTRLSETETEILIRVPVIPGCNADETNLEKTAAFIASLPRIPKVELLPYHALAESKYRRMNRDYLLQGTKEPTQQFMEWARGLFAAQGLEVK